MHGWRRLVEGVKSTASVFARSVNIFTPFCLTLTLFKSPPSLSLSLSPLSHSLCLSISSLFISPSHSLSPPLSLPFSLPPHPPTLRSSPCPTPSLPMPLSPLPSSFGLCCTSPPTSAPTSFSVQTTPPTSSLRSNR